MIYENVKEANDAFVNLVDVTNAIEGDYVLSDNGFFMPVISRSELFTRGTKVVFIQFPRYRYTMPVRADGAYIRRSLVYPLEPEAIQQKKMMSTNMKYFAKLISKGFGLMEAFSIAYNIKSLEVRKQRIHQILESDVFWNYLTKHGLLMSLKESFKQEGLDEQWLANQLKSIVEDSTASYQLRQFSLSKIIEVHNAKEVEDTNIVMNDYQKLDEAKSLAISSIKQKLLHT